MLPAVMNFISSPRFLTTKKALGWLSVFMTTASAITSLASVFSVPIGVYLLFLAIFVIVMQFRSIVQNRSFYQQDNLISRIFHFIFALDGMKLGIVYVVVAIPTFIPGFTGVFPAFAGVCVLLLGICFMLQRFAPQTEDPQLPTSVPPPSSNPYSQEAY